MAISGLMELGNDDDGDGDERVSAENTGIYTSMVAAKEKQQNKGGNKCGNNFCQQGK